MIYRTAKDVAYIFDCHESTILNWAKNGAPKHYIGDNLKPMFVVSELADWVLENKPSKYKFYISWMKALKNQKR